MSPTDAAHVSGGPAMPLPPTLFDLPIQRSGSPLDYLAAVHQRLKFMCDILEEWAAQGCVDVATAPLFARIFPDFLRRHIADEEQALLPLIRATERGKSQTATIIDGLIQEHQVCLRYAQTIADFFNTRWSGAASDLPDDIATVMADFARLKRNHIAVEKNIILVIARKSLKASHLEQLQEALASAPDPGSMTQSLDELLDRNVRWAEAKSRLDPTYFRRMAEQQTPKYLWIGCSDSRVTANDVLGLDPGEVFVHRNIANVVHTSDMNILSVLEFAIEYLGIRHIIVCGHYGCGGIERILSHERGALVDHWLQPISMMYRKHRAFYDNFAPMERLDRLCELNIEMQVRRLAQTPIIEKTWLAGRELHLHGWIYAIQDGLLRDLGPHLSGIAERDALASIDERARAPVRPLSSLQRQAASAFTASEAGGPAGGCGCH